MRLGELFQLDIQFRDLKDSIINTSFGAVKINVRKKILKF